MTPVNSLHNRGFSLIELLLVLLVIGLGSGLVVLSLDLNSEQKKLDQLADTFVQQVQLVSDNAVLSGEIQGLVVTPASATEAAVYGWYRWRDQHWQPLAEALVNNPLPASLEVRFEVDGQLLMLSALPMAAVDKQPQPLLMLYPTGESTRFSLLLTLPDSQYGREIMIDDASQVRQRRREGV